MLTRYNGRPFFALTEGDDGPDGGGGATATPTTIKVGEAVISQAELSALITGDGAGNVKVDLGDGKTATLKELRESHRRQPDVQRLLADERKKMDDEHRSQMDEVAAERQKIVDELGKVSKTNVVDLANALLNAEGGRRAQDPFATKASAIAYVNERMIDDASGAIAEVAGRYAELRDASAAETKRQVDEIRTELTALKEKQTSERAESFMREEVRQIQTAYPHYNPKGKDEFSVLVNTMLKNEEADPILDGKTGIDMNPVDVAKMVDIYLDKRAEERVTAKAAAKKAAEDAAATRAPGGGHGHFEMTDDLQKEMDAAGEDLDKIQKVVDKVAAAQKRR